MALAMHVTDCCFILGTALSPKHCRVWPHRMNRNKKKKVYNIFFGFVFVWTTSGGILVWLLTLLTLNPDSAQGTMCRAGDWAESATQKASIPSVGLSLGPSVLRVLKNII